jgi:predicted HTH domain antitoxin
MVFNVPDPILQQAGVSPSEILLKLAILLFQEDRISLGQASKLADMHMVQFQKELAKRNIAIHYGQEDYLNDKRIVENLK